jgi:hypothetical protein
VPQLQSRLSSEHEVPLRGSDEGHGSFDGAAVETASEVCAAWPSPGGEAELQPAEASMTTAKERARGDVKRMELFMDGRGL